MLKSEQTTVGFSNVQALNFISNLSKIGMFGNRVIWAQTVYGSNRTILGPKNPKFFVFGFWMFGTWDKWANTFGFWTFGTKLNVWFSPICLKSEWNRFGTCFVFKNKTPNLFGTGFVIEDKTSENGTKPVWNKLKLVFFGFRTQTEHIKYVCQPCRNANCSDFGHIQCVRNPN